MFDLASLNEQIAPLRHGGGKVFFVHPFEGSDSKDGLAPYARGNQSGPVATVTRAYGMTIDGRGDVVVLLSDNNTAANTTDYLAAALTWSNSNTHLVGINSGSRFSPRSRISNAAALVPAYGTGPLMTISGHNCCFKGIQWWYASAVNQGEYCLTVSGQRNVFEDCHIAGMGNTTASTSRANANSASLVLSGAAENTFRRCVIGVDTASRTAANTSVLFKTQATRNRFEWCVFPMLAGATTPYFLNANTSGALDRAQEFLFCEFNAESTGGASTPAVMAIVHASAGGVLRAKNCWANNVTAGSATLAITAAPGPTEFTGTF